MERRGSFLTSSWDRSSLDNSLFVQVSVSLNQEACAMLVFLKWAFSLRRAELPQQTQHGVPKY